MPLNPAEAKFFEHLAKEALKNPPTPLAEQSLEDFRKGSEFLTAFTGKPSDISVTNTFVPARDGYQIPIRIYHADLPGNSPALIMYPGCGYVSDLFEPNAIACSRIAKKLGIKVILVNFRLAPEHPLPGPIYDAYDATKYIVTHAKKFKIHPDKVFIGGLSSGAHCAAVISNLARHDKELKIYHQILLNGVYDLTQSYHVFDAYEKEDKLCTREAKVILPGQSHNTFIMRGVMSDGEDPAAVIAQVVREHLA